MNRKPYRDKYGRFAKRGKKAKPPQPRDRFGRYVSRKRKPRPKPKPKSRRVPKKSHLSPKAKPSPETLRFRHREPIYEEEETDFGESDEPELETVWQEDYEDDFSALDALDDLDDLGWADDDDKYHD